MIMSDEKRTTVDLSAKHFSRYGEFLVSFELSKFGWNVYNPVYKVFLFLKIKTDNILALKILVNGMNF